ncbi:MAG: Gfo/Idh/MocA family oxidoreductase [Proteobacteria bacterium]|nr:Gfo/Idh/MocA family oxidoreductase [Pseudomonadota bacterium]
MSSPLRRIRVGLIGSGRHGQAIIQPALRFAPIDVVATCSRHPLSTPQPATHYTSHEQMLAAEAGQLDACIVVVAVPEYLRVLGDILACGLPVWSEKPAAATVAEAKLLEQAARQAGKPLQVGFNKRFATAYEMARVAINRPTFGRATSFFGKFMMGSGYYPDESSYLVDNPIHMIDLARHFMGEITLLQVERADLADGQWSYGVTLRFASGAIGLLQFGNTQSWRQHNESVEITGEGHAITVDNVIRYCYRSEEGPGEIWEPNFTVPVDRNHSLVLTGYAGQLRHFAEVVSTGVTPHVTITDARRALELLEEIQHIARGSSTRRPQ